MAINIFNKKDIIEEQKNHNKDKLQQIENKEKYINIGDNVDRGSLSNVCHIFAQYLSLKGL